MPRAITWDDLRGLAAFEAERGCALSLYLNLDPALSPTIADVRTRINSLLAEATRSAEEAPTGRDQQVRQALREDVERVRSFFEDEFDREGAHGLAVFAGGADGFWRALPLVAPVEDAVRVGASFHLAPLVRLAGHGDGALVVSVSRERGQILRLRGGRLEEVDDLSTDQPRRHDQGGWSQARYQRSIDNAAVEHLRGVADRIDELVRREPGLEVVVVSDGDAWAELSGLLSQPASAALAGQTTAEAHASPPELLDVAMPVLEEHRASEGRRDLERWREAAARADRGVAGWAETLAAASDARIDQLLVQAGAEHPVWRCPDCGRLAAEPGACPLDGTVLEERPDGLDLLLHRTLVHGGSARVIDDTQDLEPVEGVGAILRY